MQHQYRARGPAGGKGPLHKNNTAWRIGSFEDSVDKHNRIDQLYYYDLVNDPDFLPYLMQLMDERALPFLRRSHQGVGLLSARRSLRAGRTEPVRATLEQSDRLAYDI
ncbi:hypothetical protein E0668_24260, partial [Salmonella enterica subsp. enterica]|nr:hypothetical protein [Salmonella enterica subsp. enterica serovar Paratyphi A]